MAECFKEPDVSVPVTVMVYVPAGVPWLPLPLLLPPQAAWKTKPANSMYANINAGIVPLLFRPEPRLASVTTNPISGSQTAYDSPEPDLKGRTAAVAPVVCRVSVAGVPGGVEVGLIEHVGASAGVGCTEQVRATEPLNAFSAATFSVEVDDPPGLTVPGVSAEAVR